MVYWKALVESFAVVYVVSSECVCSLRYRPVDFGQMVDSKVPKVPLKVPIGQKIQLMIVITISEILCHQHLKDG